MLSVNKLIPQGRGLAKVLLQRATSVELDWDVRQKSRFDATDSSGRKLGVFLARGAETWLGTGGLYLAGTIAGLTDVDAITLSMGQVAQSQPDLTEAAGRAVALALVANTLVKGGIAAGAGSAGLRGILLPTALLVAAAGAGVAFLL